MRIYLPEEGKWVTKAATHIALFLKDNEWPAKGKQVVQSCLTPSCVNPYHLKVVSRKQGKRIKQKRLIVSQVPQRQPARV
jgi:hypothetical protein